MYNKSCTGIAVMILVEGGERRLNFLNISPRRGLSPPDKGLANAYKNRLRVLSGKIPA